MTDRLGECVAASNAPYAFCGAVALLRQGQIVFELVAGEADRSAHLPVTFDTRFAIASITKQFTAYAVLKTCEDGWLALDRRLAEFEAGFADGERITVRHLLTHTDGLQSDRGLGDYQVLIRRAVSAEEMVARLRGLPAAFRPGERFGYGNTGYLLLGRILERVYGCGLQEVFERLIFERVGMKETGLQGAGESRVVGGGRGDTPRLAGAGQEPNSSPSSPALST